ncbi:MAG: hypothetical protein ABF917_10280 [Gluconobacter oxydans]|uniref:hypothetical protein n=1 Tax=Gluconobacter oxydans TaxID=442 RepID=UPI0039E775F8
MSDTIEKPTSYLFRLRNQDTPTGVAIETVERLMTITGLSKTEVTHLALREMADRYIPKYEMDDGPLSEEQLEAVRRASSATEIPDERFSRSLLDL